MFESEKFKLLLIAAGAAMVFQLICSTLVIHFIPVQQISFPLMLGQTTGAGSMTNLVGFGHIPHVLGIQRSAVGLMVACTILLRGCSRLPVLRCLPVAPLPGTFANLADGLVHGAVIDWIILPLGGHRIYAISLGDVIIYVGMTMWLTAVIRAIKMKVLRASPVQPSE